MAKNLKEKGLKIIIVANETKEWMKIKIKKFNLNKIFDKVYCSANIGQAKPDKGIFQHILRDIENKPEEILFIDDKEGNLNIAKSFGINTILFKNLKKLKKDLKACLANRT